MARHDAGARTNLLWVDAVVRQQGRHVEHDVQTSPIGEDGLLARGPICMRAVLAAIQQGLDVSVQ